MFWMVEKLITQLYLREFWYDLHVPIQIEVEYQLEENKVFSSSLSRKIRNNRPLLIKEARSRSAAELDHHLFAKVNKVFFNSGKQVVIRLMTPLRMSYEESYVRTFPFDKMVDGMLDPEMIEDILPIVNEAMGDKYRVNLIINNRVGGNAPLVAQMVAGKLRREKQDKLF